MNSLTTISVFKELFEQLKDPNLLYLLGFFFFLAIANFGQGKKSLLTNARFVTSGEKLRALKEAQRQLKSTKVKDVCLYCGSYSPWQMWGFFPLLKIWLTGYPPTLFVPSANQSIDIIGKAGSGKTFSAINRLVASAIDQGIPILLYDYKGDAHGQGGQIPFVATYALRHGYKLRIYAPGKDYTCVINPLDFIRDEKDMTTAKAIAENFHANLRGDSGKTDGFFGPAGKRLIYAIFLLAKGTQYPDLAMAFAILKLPKLAARLAYASQRNLEQFSFWVQVGFSQLIQVAEAEQTSSGILAGAADIITEFMQHDLLPCYLGKSNTSLYLQEKEILILQSDEERQTVINPLIASNIGLIIKKNFSVQRKVPLVACFDENPTNKVIGQQHWANRHRSKGYCGIYAAQTIEQYNGLYGKADATTLRDGCATRFWFNPNNNDTAQQFSTTLGKKEVVIKNKSTSRSSGGNGNGGVQRSVSEQIHQVPLVDVHEFVGFRQGECIYINPESKTREFKARDNQQDKSQQGRGSIPWHIRKIQVSKKDIKTEFECEELWEAQVFSKLLRREKAERGYQDLEAEVNKRLALAEQLLPLPEPPSAEPQNNFAPIPDGGQFSIVD